VRALSSHHTMLTNRSPANSKTACQTAASSQVLVKDKEHFDARFARARLYPLINEPWKAKQQYSYLLDRHPGHPEVRCSPTLSFCCSILVARESLACRLPGVPPSLLVSCITRTLA
jgi:hypothetical protein